MMSDPPFAPLSSKEGAPEPVPAEEDVDRRLRNLSEVTEVEGLCGEAGW